MNARTLTGFYVALALAACGGASVQVGTAPTTTATAEAPPPPPPATATAAPPVSTMLKHDHVKVEKDHIVITQKIIFETGKAVISEQSNGLLDEIAAVFKENGQLKKVEVQGHTDHDGDKAQNTKLSNDRAAAVVDALVKRGVSKDVLVAKGYGEDKPIADNKTPEGREQNRRVEFLIVDPGKK
jgi:OOP family OmpA-OmpF porin